MDKRTDIMTDISLLTRETEQSCIELRRDLHRHPELGWCEYYTTSKLRKTLEQINIDSVIWGSELYSGVKKLGLPPSSSLDDASKIARNLGLTDEELTRMAGGNTGLIATIKGMKPGPTIALRCEIDAEYMEESADSTHLPARNKFRSENAGIMHTCGHDGHAAIVIGVAMLLSRIREHLHGNVKLIFQPAETQTRGAVALVKAGWLDDVNIFLAFHSKVIGGLRTGQICPAQNNILGTHKLMVKFTGKPAHFSLAADQGRNALTAASAVTLLSHAIPRRPGSRSQINVGRLVSGVAPNVVPADATIAMEVRAESDDLLNNLFDQASTFVSGIGIAFDVQTKVVKVGFSPCADSDEELANIVSRAVSQITGLEITEPRECEGSQDAAAMMRHVQARSGLATYIAIGTDRPAADHTPKYDFDERIIPIGIEVLTRTILQAGNLSKA